jgi:hypothetical protein
MGGALYARGPSARAELYAYAYVFGGKFTFRFVVAASGRNVVFEAFAATFGAVEVSFLYVW